MTDLYGILGVSASATTAEIKSAYRKLARQCHPDVSASPDANARFARISEAYHILIDPMGRAAYDRGQYHYSRRTFYASRAAEVVAIEREFNRMVDEILARERQETAARSHAVLIVVPLFMSSFYVMLVKPPILQGLNLVGRMILVALAIYGLIYLVKNLALVLARYTYHVPDHLTSVFREEAPRDKPISRRAGLVFLVSGYIVSLGLGYIVSRAPMVRHIQNIPPTLSPGLLLGIFLYPPIIVLLVGGARRVTAFFNRF
jgi:hypothetical protein